MPIPSKLTTLSKVDIQLTCLLTRLATEQTATDKAVADVMRQLLEMLKDADITFEQYDEAMFKLIQKVEKMARLATHFSLDFPNGKPELLQVISDQIIALRSVIPQLDEEADTQPLEEEEELDLNAPSGKRIKLETDEIFVIDMSVPPQQPEEEEELDLNETPRLRTPRSL